MDLRTQFERIGRTGEGFPLAEDDLPAAIAAAKAVLGPPTMIQGYGPTLRWRRPDTTVLLRAARRRPRVEVVATGAFEAEELRTYDTAFTAPEFVAEVHEWVWVRADDPHALGLDRPSRAVFAATWDEFGDHLTALLEDFARTLALVADDIPDFVWVLALFGADLRCAQGIIAPEEVYAEIRRGDDDIDEHPLGSLTGAAARHSADLAMAAIRSWNLTDPSALGQRIFTNGDGWFDVHALGLRDLDDPTQP